MYNPFSLANDRLEEVTTQLQSIQIIGCPGTKIREWEDEPFRTIPSRRHFGISWGWKHPSGKHKHSNSSSGVAILLGKPFRRTCVSRVLSPPPALQGRVGGLMVKQAGLLLLLLVCYLPPFATTSAGRIAREEATTAALSWCEDCISELPARGIPFVFADVNDALVHQHGEDRHVGPYHIRGRHMGSSGKKFYEI